MSENALLVWMSAKAAGSWAQFRAAVEELRVGCGADDGADDDDVEERSFGLAVYQLERLNLQRLGHAEFFAPSMTTDWRVAPPTLAFTTHAAGVRGVLAGARSTVLLERIRAAGGTPEIVAAPDSPAVIRFVAEDETALRHVALRAGLNVQADAARAILSSLPNVAESSVRRPAEMPFGTGWKIDRFATRELRWRAATREDALMASAGLFRFSLRHQRHVLYCTAGRAFQVPVQVGKSLVLSRARRRRLMTYDSETSRLTLPAICRPPFLIERALIACSGLLPSYETRAAGGLLHYQDVPLPVAQLAAELLKQDLR